jgi:ketosteroid isomerase-like protein
LEAFPKLTVEVLELIDAGDFVIASTIFHGQGSRSGAQVEDAYVYVYKMRDGLIVEGWECRTREEALKAVGLEE